MISLIRVSISVFVLFFSINIYAESARDDLYTQYLVLVGHIEEKAETRFDRALKPLFAAFREFHFENTGLIGRGVLTDPVQLSLGIEFPAQTEIAIITDGILVKNDSGWDLLRFPSVSLEQLNSNFRLIQPENINLPKVKSCFWHHLK